jgi:hypothetical protein
MSNNEQKTQRHFVKDGDDEYMPRRPMRRVGAGGPRVPHKQCDCGGKLKPRGSSGVAGRTSAKCNKCGRRVYTQHYKGKDGLVECY